MKGAVLAGLFDDDVVTAEADLYQDALGPLTDEEAASIARAHRDRVLEFRGGRHCAREALARMGVREVSILRAEDRSPIWPPGFLGSITHSRARGRGWCAAAVVRSNDAKGIGVDGELDEPLEQKLWERVLSASERAYVESLGQPDRGFVAKLFFSAKEAAYKCQYPLTRTFLEFADVEIRLDAGDGGSFDAELRRDAFPLQKGCVLKGRYARRSGIVATAVLLR